MRYKPGAHTSAWFFWANAGRSYRRGQPLDAKSILEGKKPFTEDEFKRMLKKCYDASKRPNDGRRI